MRHLLLLFLLLPAAALAQNNLIDSLQTELSRAISDSAKVDLHCRLSKHYGLQDSKKAWQHARQALALATAAGLPAGQANARNHLGQYYLVQGQYPQALRAFYQALKIGEQTHDTLLLLAAYNNLGIMSAKMNDQDRALRYYRLAAALAKKNQKKAQLGNILNNMGDLYEAKAQYGAALQHYRQAAALLKEIPHHRGLPVALLNIGTLHLHLPDPAKGLPYLFEAYRLSGASQQGMTQVVTLGSIARIYRALGRPAAALRYARQSFDKAQRTGSDKKIAAAALLLQELYTDRQDYQQAYHYQSVFVRHQNNMHIAGQQQVAAEIKAKFDVDKKELENQHLKAEKARQATEIKHQRLLQLFVTSILLLVLIVLLLLWMSRKRLQATYRALQQANARLLAQHQEISRQKNEIAAQALVLQQQNEQLEKHHHFKNQIFSIISHDLRAPFNSIKGILNLVQHKTLPPEELTYIFDLLSRDVDGATNMLNNLLGWSKAQLHGASLHLQAVNLHQVAEENLQIAAAQAALKQIQISNEIPGQLLAFTDKERVHFVLRNLIMNALKFTYPGGHIRLQGREKAGKVEICVLDNGKGISPDHMALLFTQERFTTPGTAHEKGTGLGLRLSQEFIQTLNGDLTVESRPEQGSVFRITLPLAETPAGTWQAAELPLA